VCSFTTSYFLAHYFGTYVITLLVSTLKMTNKKHFKLEFRPKVGNSTSYRLGTGHSAWLTTSASSLYVCYMFATSHKIFKLFLRKFGITVKFLRKKWRKFISNSKYTWKIWNFHHTCILLFTTSWYKLKLWCHYKIRKSTNYGYRPKVHIAMKYWKLQSIKFSKILIGVENALDNLHFIRWTQIQKYRFLVKICIKNK